MKHHTYPLAAQAFAFLSQVFFSVIKVAVIVLALAVGVLLAGQSSVAPVSVRLLTSYAMEYAVAKFKPYRHLFPEPYLVNIETN